MPVNQNPDRKPRVTVAVNGTIITDLDVYDGVLLDYCAGCVQEHGADRVATLTTPEAMKHQGGGRTTAYYRCAEGHTWTCNWAVPESA